MPFRSGGKVIRPAGKGRGFSTYDTKTGKYSARGARPKGAPTYKPSTGIVTTHSSGEVTTEGFRSKGAARRAKARAVASRRRSRRILRQTRQAPQKVAKPPQSARVKAIPELSPTSKPKVFQGKLTVGTPALGELRSASKSGALKVNKKGFITTPQVRAVSKQLKQAKQRDVKLTGISPQEATFAKTVAKKTPLKPRTVAAWTRLEGGNSSGDFNRLNVGHTDSGPLSLTADPRWKGPKSAGKLTAQFLKGSYGGASEGIQAILPAAKGKPPAEQLKVIAGSGWATDPEYEAKLQATLASVGQSGKPIPKGLLARAKALGLGKGQVTKQQMTRFKAGMKAAKELEKAQLPYVWGGGHGDPESRPTGGGLDCSGAVSYVLNKMGVMKGSLVSGDMGSVLKPGPGAVTVFYNPVHTFMRIGKKYFGTSATNPGGGAGFIKGKPDDLSKYSVGHVPGLGKKVAVAMGVPLTPTSFPGMSLSSSGTTATITSGATQGEPGFSSKPIKLTPLQRGRHKLKALAQLGAGVSEQTEAPSTKVLEQLEAKYG